MRRLLLATLPLALAVLPARAAVTRGVTVLDDYYSPTSVSATAGDSVTWTNRGQRLHTVTADDRSFNSNHLLPGTAFTHTFQTAGSYAYGCEIHPSMRGTVVVQAAAPSTTTTTQPSTTTTTRRTTTTLPPGESAVTAPGERRTTTTSSSILGEATTTSLDGATTTTLLDDADGSGLAAPGDDADGQGDPSHAGPTALAALLLAGVAGGAAVALKRGL